MYLLLQFSISLLLTLEALITASEKNNGQAQDRSRIAAKATSDLYNAVRRGDIKAVRALIAKGADAYVQAPDGTSLVTFALSRKRKDIAHELNREFANHHLSG